MRYKKRYTKTGPLEFNVEILWQVLLALKEGDQTLAEGHLSFLPQEVTPTEDRKTMDRRTQVKVFTRDHYVCRYCGRYTVCPPALRFIRHAFPRLFPYHPRWRSKDTHHLYYVITASCDHVTPVARDGKSDVSNLVTSCYMCNSRKSNYLLEELGWELKPLAQDDWDGLSHLFVDAWRKQQGEASRTWGRLSAEERRIFAEWAWAIEADKREANAEKRRLNARQLEFDF